MPRRAARILLGLVATLIGWSAPVRADVPPEVAVLRPRVEAGTLVVDLTATDLFDDSARDALESGLPAKIQFTVEVWRHRSRVWDVLVDRADFGYRVLFDVLEETYAVYDRGGRFITTAEELGELQDAVGLEPDFEVLPIEDLKQGVRYYVLVEVALELLTVDEVADLQEWIRGSVRGEERRSRLAGLSEQVLGMLKTRMGLGERRGIGRTRRFKPEDLKP